MTENRGLTSHQLDTPQGHVPGTGTMTAGRPIRAECVLVGREMRESRGHIRTRAESGAEGWSVTWQPPSEGHQQGRNSAPHAESEHVVETENAPRNEAGDSAGGPVCGDRTAEPRSEPLCSPGHRAGNQRIKWEEGAVFVR